MGEHRLLEASHWWKEGRDWVEMQDVEKEAAWGLESRQAGAEHSVGPGPLVSALCSSPGFC